METNGKMHLMPVLIFLCLLWCTGCRNGAADSKEGDAAGGMPFDSAKWLVKEGGRYPYRDRMLDDLIHHHRLHGMHRDRVLQFLGIPDRKNGAYLYYAVDRDQLGPLTLHTKTLVIKLNSDSTVEWRKIHQ